MLSWVMAQFYWFMFVIFVSQKKKLQYPWASAANTLEMKQVRDLKYAAAVAEFIQNLKLNSFKLQIVI